MSPRAERTQAGWFVSCCPCGCKTVRFHAERADGGPDVVLVFKADKAREVAAELVEGSRLADPGLATPTTPPSTTAH